MDKKIEYILEENNYDNRISNNLSISSFNDSISEENENNLINKENDVIIKRVTGFSNSELNLEIENEQNNQLEELNINDDIKEIDILDKSYEIPLNMFKYPNNSKEIIFEDDEINSQIIILKSKKFCIKRSPIIETFLVNLFIFSEFVDPFSIEKNNQINVIFVKKNDKENKYIIDLNTLLHKLKLNEQNNNNDFIQFFNGINQFLENENFQNMKSTNLKFKLKIYFIILISLITTIFSLIRLFFYSTPKLYFFILISLILLCIILLFCYFEKFKHMNLYLLYNELDYFLKSYNLISSYVEDYNTKIFSHINIRATVPVSFNYIMFNKEPEKIIEIKHFDMISLKRYFYPKVKVIKNNQNLIKQYNEIRGTTLTSGINSF